MICTCLPSETDTLAGADPACPYHHPAGAERTVRHHQCGTSSNKPFDYIPSALAAPRAEGLDVERLREAIRNVENMNPLDYLDDGDTVDAYAAEYARLSRPSDERVPESEEPR